MQKLRGWYIKKSWEPKWEFIKNKPVTVIKWGKGQWERNGIKKANQSRDGFRQEIEKVNSLSNQKWYL